MKLEHLRNVADATKKVSGLKSNKEEVVWRAKSRQAFCISRLVFQGSESPLAQLPFWVLLKWASLSGPAFQTISYYVPVWRVGLHPVSMADFSGLGPDRS